MHENILRIKVINDLLKDLKQDFVFVGGATVSLYASDTHRNEIKIRPTDDVDVVVELASYDGYAALDEKLRAMRFQNDVFSGVICRYKIQGIIVDIMPTEPGTIGFSNRWYPEGFETAVTIQLDGQTMVKVFTAPYFMAAKMEAFNNRARDFYSSRDLEDMVFLIEHTEDFESQMRLAPTHVWEYLRDGFSAVIDLEDFQEALYGHADGGYYSKDVSHINNKIRSTFDIRSPFRGYRR
jgi:predicted nucleotidyltransferase